MQFCILAMQTQLYTRKCHYAIMPFTAAMVLRPTQGVNIMATKQATTAPAVAITKAPLNKGVTHGQAWRFYKKAGFNSNHSFALVADTSNPWQPHAPGYGFYNLLAEHKPATVGAVLQLASNNKVSDGKGHLAWLYTWVITRNVAYCTINGKAFDPAVGMQGQP